MSAAHCFVLKPVPTDNGFHKTPIPTTKPHKIRCKIKTDKN